MMEQKEAILAIMRIKNLSHDEALTFFDDLVKIKGIENVLIDIEHMEKQYYLNQHHYKIYFSKSDKRYRTYLPMGNGKRKPITSKERSLLDNKIVTFYRAQEQDIALDTLEKIYPFFLGYKSKETTYANAHKLNWAWEKYFKDSPIVKRKIDSIATIELKEWFLDIIREHQLTKRQFNEVKALLNMLYDYAIEARLATTNISRNVHGISYKKFSHPEDKDIRDNVYIDDEETRIIELAYQQFQKTQNVAYLAICMNFSLACRVGELVALKVSDFSEHTLHIQRQEIKHYTRNDVTGKIERHGYEIVPFTKTLESNRRIYVTPSAWEFYCKIVELNHARGFDSEYLLLDKNGERLNNDAINNVLRRLNRKLHTHQKGNHCIRKTCLSNMHASGKMYDEEIRAFAGHREISTTQNSYFYVTESTRNRADVYQVAIDSKIPNVFK